MSTILQGLNDSITSFLKAKLPPELTEAVNLKAEKEKVEEKWKEEREELEVFANDVENISQSYQDFLAEITSLDVKENAQLAARLTKLKEDSVKGLSKALLDSAGSANELEKSFSGIENLLKSLSSDLDLSETDYFYDEVVKVLAGLDEARKNELKTTIEEENTLVFKLKNLDPNGKADLIKELKDKSSELYNSLVSVTLEYKEVQPALDELKMLQEGVGSSIAELKTYLAAQSADAIGQATVALAALESKQLALNQLGLLNTDLIKTLPIPLVKPPAINPSTSLTPEGSKGNENGAKKKKSSPQNALEEVDLKIKEAHELLTENKESAVKLNETVVDLKAALELKDTLNANVEVYLSPLNETKKLVAGLAEQVTSLKEQTTALKEKLGNLRNGIGEGDTGVVAACIHVLTQLGTIHAEMAVLNDVVSTVDFNCDIKEYLGKVVGKLDTFPKVGKTVIDNAMLIEYAVVDLDKWSTALDDVVAELKNTLLNSSLVMGATTKGGKGKKGNSESGKTVPESKLDELIALFESKMMSDEQLIANKAFAVSDWTAKFSQEFTGETSSLADWKTFFEKKIEAMEKENDGYQKTIDFLAMLRPDTVAGLAKK